MTSGTDTVPDVALFTAAGQVVTAHRLIEVTTQDGRWARVVSYVARSAGALEACGDELPRDAIKAAEKAFRYARGLVAAEDVEAWLAQFELTVARWRQAIRREVALDRVPDAEPADAAAVDVWAGACASEHLRALSTGHVRRVAAAAALGEDVERPGADVVARFLAGAVDESQIDREVADNAMEWLRVHYTVLTAPNVDAANEARLCLTADGMTPVEVGELLGSPVIERDGWLRDAPEELRDTLLTTGIGGAAQPIARDVGADVVAVHARRQLPSDAPELRGAVRDVLAERALSRQVEDRVRWHVRF